MSTPALDIPAPPVRVGAPRALIFWMLPAATAMIVTVSGWLTDRLRRPKLLVGVTSVGLAFAFAIPLLSATWTTMIVMQAFAGVFLGAFMSIDLALMSLVLPDRTAEGRDMAILAVANSGPQIFSPTIAAALIAHFGYVSLFAFAALAALGAGAAVLQIKSVR